MVHMYMCSYNTIANKMLPHGSIGRHSNDSRYVYTKGSGIHQASQDHKGEMVVWCYVYWIDHRILIGNIGLSTAFAPHHALSYLTAWQQESKTIPFMMILSWHNNDWAMRLHCCTLHVHDVHVAGHSYTVLFRTTRHLAIHTPIAL